MTPYSRGDVILVPFPFSDQSTTEKRPAVIISSDKYNSLSSDVIIMAITSRIDNLSSVGEATIRDWQDAGLIKPSAIKAAISTIEQKLILKKLGHLSENDLESLNNTLKTLLSLL
jgi:mRNA interferase MazF